MTTCIKKIGKNLIVAILTGVSLVISIDCTLGQDTIKHQSLKHPLDPSKVIDDIEPKPGALINVGLPNGYFKWKDRVYDKIGLKFGASYQMLFQIASDVAPNATYNRALGQWTGFMLKWTLINRKKGKHKGTFVFSMMDRRALGNNALPANFGVSEVGGITTNVEFTHWLFAVENLYWEQWINFKRSKLMIRVGNQVVTTFLNPFRFKDSRLSFTTAPFCFHLTMPSPTFGFGASIKWMPSKGSGIYVAGSINDMNGDPNLQGLDWSTVGRGEFFYGVEVGYNWQRSKDDYDHVHLILFYASERSTRSPETLPNKAGWGFNFLGEKQLDQWVLFASFTYNTAQGGGVSATLSELTTTTGVAYKNPLKISGEAAIGLLYMNPIEEIFDEEVRNQYGIEMYWRIHFTRNIWVTPGAHFVIDPATNFESNFIAIPHIKFRVAI